MSEALRAAPTAAIVESDLPCGERHFRVARCGNGPPLVLLHGVTRRWQCYLPLLPALTQRWEVWAVDMRGHGGSARAADGAYCIVDYVRDIVELVTRHVPAPVVVYGHSLGALVGVAVAARLRDSVRGLVLEDPPFTILGAEIERTVWHSFYIGLETAMAAAASSNGRSRVADLAGRLADIRLDDPATGTSQRLGDLRDGASIRFMARSLCDLDPRALAPVIRGRWFDGYATDEFLSGVACPSLLLQADPAAGGMLSDAETDTAAARMSDCSVVRFSGANHLLHWSRTQDLLGAVTALIESLD